MIQSPPLDCLVIGAGPAGSTAAALVAEHGFSTMLVERDKMPRFHVGESLMPETYWTLKRLGAWDRLKQNAYLKKVGVQFVTQQGKETQPFVFREHDDRDCAETWHVRRSDFDQLIYDIAGEKGVVRRDQTRVRDVRLSEDPNEPHRATLRSSDGQVDEVAARVIIDATGQQALLANRLGLKQVNPELRKAAIWGYYRGGHRNPDGELTVILHTNDRKAWFWYIPLVDNVVSVGVVADNDYLLKRNLDAEGIYAEELAKCPKVQDRLAGAERCGELHAAKEFSYTTTQHAGQGWVLTGDAYGFIDPVYSSGVYLALKSGELAADAVAAGLKENDLSPAKLGAWCAEFDAGVSLIRKLVRAFYADQFSFGEFMKAHPEHRGNLTDVLIGRVFHEDAGRIFQDMDHWIERAMADSGSPASGGVH